MPRPLPAADDTESVPPVWPVYVIALVLGVVSVPVSRTLPGLVGVPAGLALGASPGWLFPGQPPWRLAIAVHASSVIALSDFDEYPAIVLLLIFGGYFVTWGLVAVGRAVRLRPAR